MDYASENALGIVSRLFCRAGGQYELHSDTKLIPE